MDDSEEADIPTHDRTSPAKKSHSRLLPGQTLIPEESDGHRNGTQTHPASNTRMSFPSGSAALLHLRCSSILPPNSLWWFFFAIMLVLCQNLNLPISKNS